MGKITSMNASNNRHDRAVTAILALALAVPWLGSPMAFAQEASPGDFSLPAGTPPPQQPSSNVQGPVDNESDPPRRTDEPAPSAPSQSLPSIAPVPVPTQQQRQPDLPRERRATRREQSQQTQTQTDRADAEPAATQPDDVTATAPIEQLPATTPLPVPDIPGLGADTPAPEMDAADESDRSIWWWLAAGLVALASLIGMALRQRSNARADTAGATAVPVKPTATVPTPPLRSPPPVPQTAPQPVPAQQAPVNSVPFGTLQGNSPTFGAAPVPTPAPAPLQQPPVMAPAAAQTPAIAAAPAAEPSRARETASDATPQPPRLLLDFTTLGVDVTLVNAIARYHLGITNMADITVSDVALHGTVVQARRGMPPTIDPMRGDSLLPLLQKVSDIAPEQTQRCEGQIRLPLDQIEPIEMQGRMLFVPVVHIWIGYSGPDGTRYAVTQSFVLGEESSPPGARVGPLRLDLGPRRFTEVGQRPLQPA